MNVIGKIDTRKEVSENLESFVHSTIMSPVSNRTQTMPISKL